MQHFLLALTSVQICLKKKRERERETSFRAGTEHKLVFCQAISSTENVGITGES